MHPTQLRWRHIVLNTHSTWLHGDERGFRSRGHRIHSTGDYKNPPPRHEHAPLHMYMSRAASAPTRLPRSAFGAVGMAIVENLLTQGYCLGIISVSATHVHFLVELPDEVPRIKQIVGWCKRFATRAAWRVAPELASVEIWAEGETYKPVDSGSHRESVHEYILTRQAADAWIWSAEAGPKW